jgi:hypothetical protein
LSFKSLREHPAALQDVIEIFPQRPGRDIAAITRSLW